MKIKVDKVNKVVIADGGWHGKKITATAVCQPGDNFDVEFGTELATRKWKIKKRLVRMRDYQSKASALRRLAEWASHMADDYESFADAVWGKVIDEKESLNQFVDDYYGI